MMRNVVCGAVVLGLLSCGGIAPAAAQLVSDPNAIRSCLCDQQFVLGLQNDVGGKRQALESSQRNQVSLANQVDTRRAQINVYDHAELESFKQLLQQRDAAIAATAEATRTYVDAAVGYNQAVAGYNANCAGRSYDDAVLRQVQAAPLACTRTGPRP
jgi:hypothetical protein